MVLERAFSRGMEKTCLERATLSSFPRQTAAPAAFLPEVISQSSVFVDNIVSTHTAIHAVVSDQVSALSRMYLNNPSPRFARVHSIVVFLLQSRWRRKN